MSPIWTWEPKKLMERTPLIRGQERKKDCRIPVEALGAGQAENPPSEWIAG